MIEPGAWPHPEHRSRSDGTATLPEDLLREQSIRIQLVDAVGVILWAINLVMDIYLNPHGDRGPYRLLIEGIGAAVSAGVVSFARYGRASHRTKVDMGVAFMVPHALGLALLNSWTEQPTTMRPISGITVLILLNTAGSSQPRTACASPIFGRPATPARGRRRFRCQEADKT